MTLGQVRLVLAADARRTAARARMDLQVVHTAAAACLGAEGGTAFGKLAAELERQAGGAQPPRGSASRRIAAAAKRG